MYLCRVRKLAVVAYDWQGGVLLASGGRLWLDGGNKRGRYEALLVSRKKILKRR